MSDRFIFKPRNGDEVLKASPPGTRIYLYSDLAKSKKKAVDVLKSMGMNNIILIQNPDNMNSGHWTSLSFDPKHRRAFYFSSYGGMPDKEKNKWIQRKKLRKSKQLRNVLNDGLKELARQGWVIHYNDFPYQKPGDETATCGIWTTAYLNAGGDPEIFERNHAPVDYYYRTLFGKE